MIRAGGALPPALRDDVGERPSKRSRWDDEVGRMTAPPSFVPGRAGQEEPDILLP